jgi:hypothetical protein
MREFVAIDIIGFRTTVAWESASVDALLDWKVAKSSAAHVAQPFVPGQQHLEPQLIVQPQQPLQAAIAGMGVSQVNPRSIRMGTSLNLRIEASLHNGKSLISL